MNITEKCLVQLCALDVRGDYILLNRLSDLTTVALRATLYVAISQLSELATVAI